MEAFLDTVMTRTQGLAAREGAHAAEWRQHCIPWDACIHRSVRVNSLHLATLYMSRRASRCLGIMLVCRCVRILPRPQSVPCSTCRAPDSTSSTIPFTVTRVGADPYAGRNQLLA